MDIFRSKQPLPNSVYWWWTVKVCAHKILCATRILVGSQVLQNVHKAGWFYLQNLRLSSSLLPFLLVIFFLWNNGGKLNFQMIRSVKFFLEFLIVSRIILDKLHDNFFNYNCLLCLWCISSRTKVICTDELMRVYSLSTKSCYLVSGRKLISINWFPVQRLDNWRRWWCKSRKW